MADQPVIKNRAAVGDLDVPLLRRAVAFGEEIEVKVEHAENLLAQYANWEAVNDAAKAILARIEAAEAARNAPTPDAPVETATPAPVVVAPVTPPASTPAPATPAPAAPAPDATKEASA